MSVVAIIQARMGSTRLPGKVFKDLAGEPMLARVVSRVSRAHLVDRVVVATTIEPADDALIRLCRGRGWECLRGSRDDVLDRYYRAARHVGAGTVVRITSDCPLIDPGVVDQVVAALSGAPPVRYAANCHPNRTYPRGLDIEAFPFEALEEAWRSDRDPATREHVTPYMHKHPDQFPSRCVANPVDHSGHRWTVDMPEDFELVRRIYEHFRGDGFAWTDVLELLDRHPDWLELNRHIRQKAAP